MKRFKTISATFIIIIAVIFACNVCYYFFYNLNGVLHGNRDNPVHYEE